MMTTKTDGNGENRETVTICHHLSPFITIASSPAKVGAMPQPPISKVSRSGMFEELHRALVLLRRRSAFERAKVAPLAGLRVFLSRVKPVATSLEFANHAISYAEARLKQ